MLLGIFIGAFIGITLMCLLQINRENNQIDYKRAIKNFGDHIALIIYQEKRIGNKDVKGMEYIQKLFEQYFEYKMYK